MLWPLLALLLLPLSLAAKKSAHEQLVDLAAAGNGLIHLNEQTYDLLASSKRNWSAAVLFTALNPQRRCAPCKEFDPSFTAVAKAWATAPKEQRDQHFFATLDFDDGHAVFQKLGMASAPGVHVYPATEGPNASAKKAPFKYDFQHGFEAGPLAEQLSVHTPIPIPYKAPFDWARAGSIASLIPIITLIFRFIKPALQNRWVWAAGTITTSLIMTSGYMFTRIRGAPYVGPNGAWIAQGYQNQYGQEVQVIAMVYGILAGSFLMLTVVTPRQLSPGRQRTQVYLWTAVNFLVFSILVSLFRVKNPGYPFKLII
ncbi:hypothetical protein DEU56DRAFT_763201 [Suillus clintonianus]|uniref:uncharacterized protein n=1 Tax=Suillus clintonianus TaxID=1904413 RepID=UPI001B873B33|nr:uncharacterized protein DEU56DRAFT_763201 [Suillus clintonianus]KAG2157126.1 hypothetical protein DEU56DRAFT_763201 [Suillus clintonianus]